MLLGARGTTSWCVGWDFLLDARAAGGVLVGCVVEGAATRGGVRRELWSRGAVFPGVLTA